MATNKWISKLERVVGFKSFKKAYNIEFSQNNSLIYLDSKEQVYNMLTKLITDLIENSATGKFRFKYEFDNYIAELPGEFKTQIKEHAAEQNNENSPSNDNDDNIRKDNDETSDESADKDSDEEIYSEEPTAPKNITKQHRTEKQALRLSKEYSSEFYACLGEKGKEILVELESMNCHDYPNAAVALCRSVLEYVVKLWLGESKKPEQFDGNNLPTSYNFCINDLRNRNIIDDKQHKILMRCANKEHFIDFLNS
jgi:flagellar biosynthesis GTPase FlhF